MEEKKEKQISLYTAGSVYALQGVIKAIDTKQYTLDELRNSLIKLINKLIK